MNELQPIPIKYYTHKSAQNDLKHAPLRSNSGLKYYFVLLISFPSTCIRKISQEALRIIHQTIDPYVFEMSRGGGWCGGGYSKEDFDSDLYQLARGCHGQKPLLNGTRLKIKIGEATRDEYEIEGMSFFQKQGAPTLVMCFGKDATFAASPWMMLQLGQQVQTMGMNLLLIDLPNHGNSKGKANEGSCLDTVKAAYGLVKTEWQVDDSNMFFLGQSLSSGLVGSLVEQHPDINPIFVDPYANLSDISAYIPILGPLFKPLFKLLYKLSTLGAIRVLRGHACVIAVHKDQIFGDSPVTQIMKVARQVNQSATFIMIKDHHGEKGWMDDKYATSYFETYLKTTLEKAAANREIQNLTQLRQYLDRYRLSLSDAERYALAKKSYDLLLAHSNTPDDYTRSIHTGDLVNNYLQLCEIIWNCLEETPLKQKYGTELQESFLEKKYHDAINAGNTDLAKAWVDLVSQGRFAQCGKAIKEHWATR